MKIRSLLPVGIASLALMASSGVAGAGQVTKPSGDLVPSGVTVVKWRYPLPLANSIQYGTLTVRTPSVVARVRALVNVLPAWNSANQICPADIRLPYTVEFFRGNATKPVTSVVFQLGGCPSAQVLQNGHAQHPLLGGPHLASTYATIQKLIAPHGQPLS
jgi:hypothetical protein